MSRETANTIAEKAAAKTAELKPKVTAHSEILREAVVASSDAQDRLKKASEEAQRLADDSAAKNAKMQELLALQSDIDSALDEAQDASRKWYSASILRANKRPEDDQTAEAIEAQAQALEISAEATMKRVLASLPEAPVPMPGPIVPVEPIVPVSPPTL